MISYHELDYTVIDTIIETATLIKGRKNQPSLYNLACSFDIETTSITYQDEKVAFMYIWMFQIEDVSVYGRTWGEYQEFIKTLSKRYGLSTYKALVVYVHNLSYEFQFMKNYFEWENVFAVAERKPIKALEENGILYKDSYILSGYSLAVVAKNLHSHTIEKLTGDLDYSKVRTSKTPLTQQELDYCEYDVRIVVYYIREQLEEYQDVSKIPLTNTGRVRNTVRNNCFYTSKNHRKSSTGKYKRYSKLIHSLTLDEPTYKQCLRAFQGGFTHANANYTNKTLTNVTSIDFTSSYPTVMVAEKFPMSSAIPLEVKNYSELKDLGRKYCLIFDIQFKGLISKIDFDNYLSESKCWNLKNVVTNNGRIFKADTLETTITNVDLDIIEKCYSWESVKVINVKGFAKDYLPKAIIESIMFFYQGKTELKSVKGKEVEYMRSKGMLNSVYGMAVTNVVQDSSVYECGEWKTETPYYQDEIDKYNRNNKRFLYYPWGIFVTAYARRNLWSGILEFKSDYIYSDTDSIKCLNYDNHSEYIEKYNTLILKKISHVCNLYGLDDKAFSPKTIKGIEKPIGIWDYEGTYSRFKTLGAKRYLTEHEGELEITVAGLSKKNGLEYMIEQSQGDTLKVFEMFNDDLYIPSDRTGKNTHTYIDREMRLQVTDFMGNTCDVTTKGGVHLEPCDFTLSIAKQYGAFLLALKQGYLFKGVEKRL